MSNIKKTFVTTADSNRLDLLYELIFSIRKYKELDDYKICILSTNLTDLEKDKLSKFVDEIVESVWKFNVPEYKIRNRHYLRSCTSIPFINEYFQNYDVYIWIDSDAWINDPACIELYYQSALNGAIGITPETDRAYGDLAKVKWFFGIPIKINSIYYKGVKRSFNKNLAKKMAMKQTLNAGVWSLHKNSEHWKLWQELIFQATKKGRLFTADQVSLGLMVYENNLKAEFLPAYCNWLCEVKPMYDEEKNKFVEPYLPYHNIGIMHLAALDIRDAKENTLTNVNTIQGNIVQKSLRFSEH